MGTDGEIYCTHCGAGYRAGEQFCSKCGTKLLWPAATTAGDADGGPVAANPDRAPGRVAAGTGTAEVAGTAVDAGGADSGVSAQSSSAALNEADDVTSAVRWRSPGADDLTSVVPSQPASPRAEVVASPPRPPLFDHAELEEPTAPPRKRPAWTIPVIVALVLVGLAAIGLAVTQLGGHDTVATTGASSTTSTPTTTAASSAPSTTAAPNTSTTAAIGTTTTVPTTTTTAGPALSNASQVVINGIGPVRVGMTVAEAEKASGRHLTIAQDPAKGCGYVTPDGLAGLSFMVSNATIARVDVEARSFTTRSGMGIGSTEAEVKAAYPGRITVEPHQYNPNGHYLVYTPQTAQDKEFRIVFETDGNRVDGFHAGRLPEVKFPEGCS